MSKLTREEIISTVKESAEDWQGVVYALEDGAYLKSIGVTDDDQSAVEDAHDLATKMTATHPEYKF